MTLEKILQEFFGCNKPFLKQKCICGYWTGNPPEPEYEYLAKSGGRAYNKLTRLLYALALLLGSEFDANHWISILDQIVSEED